jgi:hypothetical protein
LATDFAAADVGAHAPVSLKIGAYTSSPSITADYDNFKINAGYIAYRYVEDFTGYINGAIPDSKHFNITNGTPIVNNNALVLSVDANHTHDTVWLNYPMKGNFDIMIKFDLINAPATVVWALTFGARVGNDPQNQFYIGREYNTVHRYYGSSTLAGVESAAIYNSTATTGYLKIARTGTTVYSVLSTSSTSWYVLHSRSNFPTGDMYIWMQMARAINSFSASGSFDNFRIVNKPFNDLKTRFPLNSKVE